MLEEARDSLERRVGAMHELWRRGVADLTVEHLNHFERPGVLPIAFTLTHCIPTEDFQASTLLLSGPHLWESDGWARKVGLSGETPSRGTPMHKAEKVRLGDLDAWRSYQALVFQ